MLAEGEKKFQKPWHLLCSTHEYITFVPQLDFLEHSAVKDVIVCSTVLEEVGVYACVCISGGGCRDCITRMCAAPC